MKKLLEDLVEEAGKKFNLGLDQEGELFQVVMDNDYVPDDLTEAYIWLFDNLEDKI